MESKVVRLINSDSEPCMDLIIMWTCDVKIVGILETLPLLYVNTNAIMLLTSGAVLFMEDRLN